MSSMIHGIRILSKQGCHLTFKTFLIYSDWDTLPKTHGFPLLFFSDYTDYWKLGETAFDKDLETQKSDIYEEDGHIALCRHYVKNMVVSDFQNLPVKPEFLEYTWHYMEKDSTTFHFEEHLPQAIYELEVSDPKWIEHIPVGATWETTACDLAGPYWYLETPGEKGKFYKIFQSIEGRWMLHYGKKGTKGRTEQAKYMSALMAGRKVKEKIKKGYQLIYQNFNTDWNVEEDLKREAEKKLKKDRTPPDTDAFFKALEKRDFTKIEKLLSGELDPNTLRDEWDNYALEAVSDGYGATENSYKIAKLLFEKGADPDLGNYGPFFPGLCYANWDNPWQEKIIKLFLDNGVDISLIGSMDSHSVLQTATVSGRIELLKRCIDAGLDVMHRSAQGHTALHYAAENTRHTKEIIDMLLERGADVNDNNGSWGTPLHFAATKGTRDSTLYLVEKGADIHAQDSEGRQPIHLVAEFGDESTFEAFLELGANLESETNDGVKPIELIVGRLLGFRPEVNQTALRKLNVLNEHTSITWRDNRLVNALFQNSRSKKKLTENEASGLIELVNLGFSPFLQDSKGFNLFLFSVKTQNLNLIKACLSYSDIAFSESDTTLSGPVNLQDEYGWTALHYAKAAKNGAILNLMFQSDHDFDGNIASKKQRKIFKVKYPRGTTAESLD